MTDITITGLGIGLLLMLIPIWLMGRMRTGLVHSTISATLRMIVQLYLIGLYMQYLFEYDIWYVNLAWGLIMVFVAAGTALQRTKLKPQILLTPLIIAFSSTALVIALYFLAFVLHPHDNTSTNITISSIFAARHFIPIFGLLLGNMLGVNVVALSTYYESLKREQSMYYYLVGNGASRWEATMPFLRKSIVKAFNPCIANMAVMGLVAMPGTMIGQILGGADPSLAIKYQMMIVIITFAASLLSLIITVILAQQKSFDTMGRLKDVFIGT